MNKHFDYQESLTRIESEVRKQFTALVDFCDEDKEHLADYRERFSKEEYEHISAAYSLYHSEATTAMAGMLEFIRGERVRSERQQSLEMAVKSVCPECNDTGEVFSGYYGHPETSDGGPVMYYCGTCAAKRLGRK